MSTGLSGRRGFFRRFCCCRRRGSDLLLPLALVLLPRRCTGRAIRNRPGLASPLLLPALLLVPPKLEEFLDGVVSFFAVLGVPALPGSGRVVGILRQSKQPRDQPPSRKKGAKDGRKRKAAEKRTLCSNSWYSLVLLHSSSSASAHNRINLGQSTSISNSTLALRCFFPGGPSPPPPAFRLRRSSSSSESSSSSSSDGSGVGVAFLPSRFRCRRYFSIRLSMSSFFLR